MPAGGDDAASQKTANAINHFVAEAARVLKDQAPTNAVTLRGFARYPKIDTLKDIYGLRAAAIAVYPMYKGLARLVGMDVLDAGATLGDQMETLEKVWDKYDFFFLHYKYSDSTGEDGNFAAKVEMIERLDTEIAEGAGIEPGRADRDRRPQHAEQAEEPQLASGADDAAGRKRAGRTR